MTDEAKRYGDTLDFTDVRVVPVEERGTRGVDIEIIAHDPAAWIDLASLYEVLHGQH